MTLTIKDLSASKELDREAMCAVLGGISDRDNSVHRMPEQTLSPPGGFPPNLSIFGGPVN